VLLIVTMLAMPGGMAGLVRSVEARMGRRAIHPGTDRPPRN
jgi:hypothetical protein